MPQNPTPVTMASSGGKQAQARTDGVGTLLTGVGSTASLNNTATGVIKATAGRLGKIIVVAPGTTSGNWTLNDAASVGGATTANILFSIAYNATTNFAGAVFNLDIPFANGLVISAVPSAGSPQINVVYT